MFEGGKRERGEERVQPDPTAKPHAKHPEPPVQLRQTDHIPQLYALVKRGCVLKLLNRLQGYQLPCVRATARLSTGDEYIDISLEALEAGDGMTTPINMNLLHRKTHRCGIQSGGPGPSTQLFAISEIDSSPSIGYKFPGERLVNA
jgi:hypothetical protein